MPTNREKPSCKDAAKLVRIAGAQEGGLDLTAVQQKLASATGPRYWRSLEELAESPAFEEMLHREFPRLASEWKESVSRRDFLILASASLALAGLSGCTKQPLEPIVPYVDQPEQLVLGKPLYFATAFPVGGIARPLLVKSNEGRPTKVEGNPQHGASLGATDVYSQASVLSLYDPERSQVISYLGVPRSWDAFFTAARQALGQQRASGGAGLRFLTETVASPTLASQINDIVREFPQARWHQWEPINRDNVHRGAEIAFGQTVETLYRLDQADVIVSLEADFLAPWHMPGSLRYARQFTTRRKLQPGVPMNRLYTVESTPSLTGAKADHRLVMKASEIEGFARALALRLGWAGAITESAPDKEFLDTMVSDLGAHRGRCVIIPGAHQSPSVHALAHVMNERLGNVGNTVIYTEPIQANPVQQGQSLGELVRAIDAGRVEMLVIVGGNPAYTASTELDFSKKLEKVPLRIRLGMYEDETSALCHWHVPETHYLESWSDARAYDGTVSIIQPLIAPLYNGRTVHEFMAAFSQQPEQSSYQIVRAYWKGQHQEAGFEQFWRSALHDGFIPGTAAALKQVRVGLQALPTLPEKSEAVEIIFRPDPHIYDGRFANNAWLQELPKPLTKLTWENAALVSPAMAGRMGLHSFDVVELERAGRKLKAPVLVIPGHPDNAVTVELGYGRQLAGRTGSGKGFNAYALRRSGEWFAGGVRVSKTGETWHLATTQNHHLIDVKAAIEEGEKREPVRVATLEEFIRNPNFAQEHSGEHASLYPEFRYEGYAWGMAIDLNSCIGCNACVVACQAENNIPVVGREQVIMQRAMHWLRVDTYHEGDLANPRTYFQPLPCMHCENAPCEVVCPVAATVHSSEGLNDMVYNRCVGTRYCSNNCPYKVRRFNFLLFADYTTPSLKLLYNPDVTVRSRGVMEKCTYCVQRINRARIEAEKEDRKVRDGEFTTACAQACPGDAIIFGDINDPNSRVHKLRNSARNYDLLGELNTRPRTRYLAGVRNPNPELEREQPKHA